MKTVTDLACTRRRKAVRVNNLVWKRIAGQLRAIETALSEERDCSAVLQQITSCRGAITGLMAEVLEGHIRLHVLDTDKKPTSAQSDAAEELIDIIKSYLR